MTTTPNTAGSATGFDLAALTRYDHQGCCMAPDATGDYFLIADVRDALARATPQQEPAPTLSEVQADEAKLYRDLTGDAMALGFDGVPAALEALRATPQHHRPTDDALWDATLRDRDQYHEWADKLAGAIAIHFGVNIGEHSNMNLPWAEALDAIESAPPPAAADAATPQHSVTEQDERKLFEAALADELRADQGEFALTRGYDAGNPYTFLATKWAYRAWKAARAQPRASTAATQPEQADERSLYEAACAKLETPGDWWAWQLWQARAALAIPASTAASEQQAGADERERFKAHFMAEGWNERSFDRYEIYDPTDERGYKSRHVTDMWDGWKAALTHRATTSTPEPVVYQFRTKPDWNERMDWTEWENCTKGKFEDCLRVPRLHSWLYEVRALGVIAATPDIATTAADQQGDTASASDGPDQAEFEVQARHQGANDFTPVHPEFLVCNNGWAPATYRDPMTELAWRVWANKPAQQGAAQAQAGDVARWISVKDQLPETRHECTSRDMMVSDSFYVRGVALDGGEGFGMADYQDDGKWHCYGGDYDFMHIIEVTHYLPARAAMAAPATSGGGNG